MRSPLKSPSKSRFSTSSSSSRTTEKCFIPLNYKACNLSSNAAKGGDPRCRGSLAPHEEALYKELLAQFSRDGYRLPDWELGDEGDFMEVSGKEGLKLTEKEKFWLSRECLLRYLRASKWNAQVAAQKLEFTLIWRREYGLYDTLTPSSVEHEAVTGKYLFYGYDVDGRPAFYVFPSRQNTENAEGHVRFAFWMVERGIELMGPGVETFNILLNFSTDRTSTPSYTEATSLIHIMQSHYPERLGICSLINIPFLINAFLKLTIPFLDPLTRQKLRFNQSVLKEGLFTTEMLMKEWEGDKDFEYVHEKYWPALLEMCEGNAARWMKRWRELGAKVGTSEWDYKHERGSGYGTGDVDPFSS